ncbi:MAG: DUF5069 domain-containing protein [Opitutaceae bacterium]
MKSSSLPAPALDLTKTFPRSPRETLAGYIHAGRMLDKCRAVIAGTNGEYHYNCPLDRFLFDFTGIDPEEFKTFVATGADDAAVAEWITTHSKVKDRSAVVVWNNKMRDLRLSDMPLPLQEFLEGYIPKFIPKNRPVRVWFDVYDLEEGRQ